MKLTVSIHYELADEQQVFQLAKSLPKGWHCVPDLTCTQPVFGVPVVITSMWQDCHILSLSSELGVISFHLRKVDGLPTPTIITVKYLIDGRVYTVVCDTGLPATERASEELANALMIKNSVFLYPGKYVLVGNVWVEVRG